ncbi:MAG TPA: hypothetical protein VF132_02275 [Rudaea sp.]
MRFCFAVLLALAACVANAAGAPPQPGCPMSAAGEHRQFDFWIGQWEVTGAKGQIAGHSRIDAVSDGCAISEHWEGTGGSRGVSYNAWDPASKHWYQFWVGNTSGDVLYLKGGMENGSMVLQGTRANPTTGKPQAQRITWTPNSDGTVRQFWEQSDDDGKTWTAAFDGLYRRKK